MVNPSQHKSQNTPPSDTPGTLPPPGQFQPQFISHPLNASDPLKQVQSLVGHRPFLLIGEGSHRTHEFFSFQAQMATLAIEQGCRNIFLEVPQLWVSELTDIFKAGGDAQAIREHIRSNFYYTWSDSSMVELLITIGARNAQTPNDPVNVYGIDPQVRGGVVRLDLLQQSIRNGTLKAEIGQLKDHWKEFEDLERDDIPKLEDQAGPNPTPARTKTLQQIKTCEVTAFRILNNPHLSPRGKRLVRALLSHSNISRHSSMKAIMAQRDIFMAYRIAKGLAHVRADGSSPKGLVFAHNTHVSFGEPGRASNYFVDGMGQHVRSALEKRYGPDCCATICQTAMSGELALTPGEIRNANSLSRTHTQHPSTDPIVMGELQKHKTDALLMHFFPAQATNPAISVPMEMPGYGRKDPRTSPRWAPNIYPGAHLELRVVLNCATAAQWVV